MDILNNIDLLEVDEETLRLASRLMETGLIPPKAKTDTAHIAIATRRSMNFLLPWNCAHIANAEMLVAFNFVVAKAGYFLPTICTPDELFGGEEDEQGSYCR